MPLLFVRPRLYRKLVDRFVGFWLVLPSGLMEYVFGVKLVVRGELVDRNKPALIIMNHRTRLDWLFFWNALFRMDPWLLTTEKISLKGMLKHVPGAGWAMASNCFIFLDRVFQKDGPRIETLVEYYSNLGFNYQLLLFPEGTDKCPIATANSKRFADKNGLVHYGYVLHPRVTGFTHIVQKMRECNYIDNIYDVTVGYPEEIVQSELDLGVLGACPKKIVFDVRKIEMKDVPKETEQLGEWLVKLWEDKEVKLEKFYEKPLSQRVFDTKPGDVEFKLSTQTFVIQAAIVGAWCVIYQFMLAMLTMTFFVGCQFYYGGLEYLLSQQAKQPALAPYFGYEIQKSS
ncbi:unnamed protein product [Bursaphelenchus xylophilus]|uniref:(pine wood nematode) hypothetical protein n=1 Tax=Bursaphelenchus xylophilus TaxID=6326 RepID=A0A7I8X692_BURXY|nr:unnamed protein product [Bursaphelenchus xylophilus]CAG9123202.1 unnamed protein product [Bursaphelenchus xylophilus]